MYFVLGLVPETLLLLPYLPNGLRFEYVVVALLTFPCLILKKYRVNSNILLLAGCLFFSLLPLIISSAYSSETGLYASPLDMFARLALPGVMLIFFSLIFSVRKTNFDQSIDSVVIVSSLVSGVSILSFLVPGFNNFLSPWVSGNEEGVWYQSIAVGRVVGIFNQPLEAGLFYSVALFSVITRFWLKKSVPFGIFSLVIIVLAGVLTLSKIFLVLGIFLGFIFALVLGLISLNRFFLIIFILIPLVPVVGHLLAPLYVDSLIQLYDEFGLLFALTAGRLGAPSENTELYLRLLSDFNWIIGFGLGSQLPLDSGYLEYFYQGGFASFAGYLMFICCCFFYACKKWNSIQGRLLFFLSMLLVLASFGGPVVSAGRANIAFVLLLVVALTSDKVDCRYKREVM
ncbi:hypothetical protein ACHEXL_02370 [Limnohabitans sp. yimb22184]|uniref:hypothetical protein n=1 Tax=Limnohabitans sp. YIMB22184 TaxID=3374104 RepID=UPI003A8A4B86